jgi:hypothetical protein
VFAVVTLNARISLRAVRLGDNVPPVVGVSIIDAVGLVSAAAVAQDTPVVSDTESLVASRPSIGVLCD